MIGAVQPAGGVVQLGGAVTVAVVVAQPLVEVAVSVTLVPDAIPVTVLPDTVPDDAVTTPLLLNVTE